MFTIIQEFTEKYCGFRGSLFSIHPLSGYERLRSKSVRLPCSLSVTGLVFLSFCSPVAWIGAVSWLRAGPVARATASKIPVILAVLDGNLVYSYNVYYWHSFNNHPNYGCKSLEYSQNFRSITVSGLPYLMKNPHFDAVALALWPLAK